MKRKGVENASVRAIWSIDPATGKGRVVERGDYDTVSWDVDLAGEARIRTDIDELTHRVSVFGRAKGKSQWTQLWAEGAGEPERTFLGYSEPEDAVYLERDGKLLRRKLAGGAEEPVSDGGPSMGLDPGTSTATPPSGSRPEQSAPRSNGSIWKRAPRTAC